MNWLRQLLYGRYGMDQLGSALVLGYLVCYFLSIVTRVRLFWWLALLLFGWEFFRMFSRRVDKRRQENERFLRVSQSILRKLNVCRCRMKDREHAYFKCPGCGQQLRAPKGKGKISVTCRSCGATFEKKT